MFRLTWGGHVHNPGIRAAAHGSQCVISIGIRELEVRSGGHHIPLTTGIVMWPTT
jgi:hypothetical protein